MLTSQKKNTTARAQIAAKTVPVQSMAATARASTRSFQSELTSTERGAVVDPFWNGFYKRAEDPLEAWQKEEAEADLRAKKPKKARMEASDILRDDSQAWR